MSVQKDVKEYSGRQRINLNKGDGFNDGDIVIVMAVSEFEEIKEQLLQLNEYKAKVEAFEKIAQQPPKDNDETIEKISQGYEERLDKKDNELKEKDKEISRLKDIFSNYEKRIYGLNLFDMILRKNKKLSDEFHDSIWIINENETIDTEKKMISNK